MRHLIHKNRPQQGFSLIELSIVLVIIGLLTGGILTGQSLIRASEVRSVATEVAKYRTAVMSFRDQYKALPGDMKNATTFWGSMTNCGAASPSGTGTQTCNGNNDRDIDAPAAAAQTGEMFGFWKHLANADLIEGTYTGIAGPNGSAESITGVNVPPSKLGADSGYRVLNQGNPTVNTTWLFAGNYGNAFMLGNRSGGDDAVLSAEEMWGIDTKLDDGYPAQGFIFSAHATRRPGCATTDDPNTAKYDLTTGSQIRCTLFAKSGF